MAFATIVGASVVANPWRAVEETSPIVRGAGEQGDL